MPAVEDRLSEIEEMLAQVVHAQLKNELEWNRVIREIGEAQNRTDLALDRLAADSRDFKDEMRLFKDEMSAFKVEAEKDRKRMDKAWGDLANKMGTVLEDIVAPNIRRVALEEFGCDPLDYVLIRANKRTGDRRRQEYDVVVSGGGNVVVAESKSTVSLENIKIFAEKLERFFEFFPQFDGNKLIPVFESWSIPEAVIPELNSRKFYGLEMGEETMRIVNRGAF